MRQIFPYALAVVISAVLGVLAVPETFGAHPWWATKSIWIGLPTGLVLALGFTLLKLPKMLRTILFLLALCVAVYAAIHGKSVFVNSYAENALAGKFWYFGWISTMAATSGLIVSLTQK